MTKLTQKVLDVKKGIGNVEELIHDMWIYVHSYIREKTNLDEDMRSEFILYFYPRLRRMIAKFSYSGTPFEYYMNVHLKYQVKTYRHKHTKRKLENLLNSNTAFTSEIFGTPFSIQRSYDEKPCREQFPFSSVMKKRLLIALLKSYINFDEDELTKICKGLDISIKTLEGFICKIEEHNCNRRKRFKMLSEQRNTAFSKMFSCQERLRVSYCKEEKKEYRSRIEKYTRTLHRLVREIKAVTIAPSHRELSEIMNIPKGTIDSSMYYLRNYTAGHNKKANAA